MIMMETTVFNYKNNQLIMPYVVKRVYGKLYVYRQFRVGKKIFTKYIGSLEKIVNFYLQNKDNFNVCGRRDLNPGHRRGRPAS